MATGTGMTTVMGLLATWRKLLLPPGIPAADALGAMDRCQPAAAREPQAA